MLAWMCVSSADSIFTIFCFQLHAQWGPIIMQAWMCVSSADSIFTIILFSVACPVGTYHNASLDVCKFC